jgi:formate hydrogenlyase transcriptional activator
MSTEPVAAPERVAERYKALVRLSGTLAAQSPRDLAMNLAREIAPVLDFDYLSVLVFKEGTPEVLWQSLGSGQIPAMIVPVNETPAWWVFENQERLSISDWNRDERFVELRQALNALGFTPRSVCAVPLTTHQHPLGVFAISSMKPRAYSEEEEMFCALLADGLALVIDNALHAESLSRAQAELSLQNARLELLLDLANQVTSNLNLRELLRVISASVRRLMECDAAGVALRNSVSGKFHIYASDIPDSKGFIREEMEVPYEGATKAAIDSLRPVIVNQQYKSELSAEAYHQFVGDEGFKSKCMVPVVSRGRAVGLLGLARRAENAFREEDADFLVQVAGQIAIAIENACAYREISELKDKLAQEKLYLEEEIRTELNFEQIVGNSAALQRVLQLVDTVAPGDSTVLLLGETGTGKELIARAIHEHSRRQGRTFVKLNCAAIPSGLVESELFGHEKGSFTGAIAQKPGRLELADQGTLFLDEVGDIPLDVQPKLLRVLQEREFERLGGTHTRKVNIRLVAATNRNLEQMIANREFRSDLYYRLNVFPIQIPPLRERREDIPLLVRYFVQKFARQMQKQIDTIPAATMKRLSSADWPGNIRELENVIERAVILTRGKSLEVALAGLDRPATERAHHERPLDREDVMRIVQESIRGMNPALPIAAAGDPLTRRHDEIVRALSECKGRVAGADGAAQRLGINRTTLLSRMKKLGIDPRQFS